VQSNVHLCFDDCVVDVPLAQLVAACNLVANLALHLDYLGLHSRLLFALEDLVLTAVIVYSLAFVLFVCLSLKLKLHALKLYFFFDFFKLFAFLSE